MKKGELASPGSFRQHKCTVVQAWLRDSQRLVSNIVDDMRSPALVGSCQSQDDSCLLRDNCHNSNLRTSQHLTNDQAS